jgi:hypothetical protein
MTPDPANEPSTTRRHRRTIRLLLFIVLAGSGGWILMSAEDDRPGHEIEARTTGVAETPSALATTGPVDAAIPAAPLELPEGALPPILGEPRLDRIDYCDDRNWSRLDVLVREVRGEELIVDESAWQDAGASTRAGLASWASKCRLDGRALVVRAHGSGRELGAYDAAFGYEILD